MCQSLRAQWAAASRPVVQTLPKVTPAQPTTQAAVRYETRYRSEPYRVKVCHGSYCTIETRYRQVAYRVAVPVANPAATQAKHATIDPKLTKPLSRFDCTSPDFARDVLAFIRPNASDVVYDLGCGDGELLAAAAPYGCQLIGIEIDGERAAEAAQRVPAANVVHGDIMHQIYSDGTIFLMYLFDDLIADVLPKLPSGALVVSLEHPIPGMDAYEHRVGAHRFYVGVKG